MKKRHVLAVACSLALAWSTAALAQLAPANDMGVALGHIHLAVKDVEANLEFFEKLGNPPSSISFESGGDSREGQWPEGEADQQRWLAR